MLAGKISEVTLPVAELFADTARTQPIAAVNGATNIETVRSLIPEYGRYWAKAASEPDAGTSSQTMSWCG